MKKDRPKDPEMLDEYDFRGGVRGKHYAHFAKGTNLVVLDPDVSEAFQNSEAVNDALRAMAQIIERHRRQSLRTHRRAQTTQEPNA